MKLKSAISSPNRRYPVLRPQSNVLIFAGVVDLILKKLDSMDIVWIDSNLVDHLKISKQTTRTSITLPVYGKGLELI